MPWMTLKEWQAYIEKMRKEDPAFMEKLDSLSERVAKARKPPDAGWAKRLARDAVENVKD